MNSTTLPDGREPDMRQTEKWLANLRKMGRKDNTLASHRSNVRQCLLYLLADDRDTDARRITTDDVMYLWRAIPVKEEVRRAYLRSLAGMVIFYTGVDVVKQTNILHNREVRNRVFITKDEFRTAYAAANPFQKVILCLGAYMGLRRGEMSNIRDSDIDGCMMTIHGKGHGEDGLVAVVRIPEPVMQAIEEYRRSPMKKGRRKDDYLLQTRGKRRELHRANVSKISTTISDLGAKTDIKITTHSLRRFFATTLYYETNCDLQTVRNLMRHADVSTTLKCYVDAYDEKEREASAKLTEFIDGLVSTIEN